MHTKYSTKVILVMPAYNAEKTLEMTVKDIPENIVDEIILVDDASSDRTVHIAENLGITVHSFSENKGYGANQKQCYTEAIKKYPDIIIMIHPDYQYDSRLIPHAIGFIESGICDIVIGCRIRSRAEALQSGMPRYKYIANRFLTFIENLVLGQNLGDFHSGFRAYSKEVIQTIPYLKNSDDFVFDSEFLAQAAYFDFIIGDIPIPCRYFPESSSINFPRSIKYGFQTLLVLIKYMLHKTHLCKFDLFVPRAKK
ncbi:MAG: glycosyltransferase family 2 protein [Pseudomonadota bacterium]